VLAWRFSQHASLDGRGGLLASARWHTRGREIIYCAPNPATALLEILVHQRVRSPAALSGHSFIEIEIPDPLSRDHVADPHLPPDWSRRLPPTCDPSSFAHIYLRNMPRRPMAGTPACRLARCVSV
jgi:RES domain-containing protein